MYCYHSGNFNGFVIEPWFILAKVLGWHNNNIIKVYLLFYNLIGIYTEVLNQML